MSIWDDPDLQVNDDYVKFENAGDTVTGEIIATRIHRFDDKAVPQLVLRCDDGVERTVTAGQARLKAILSELRPTEGQTITITMTNLEKRQGGKTLKHFEVDVADQAKPAKTPKTKAAPAEEPTAGLDAETVAALAAAGITSPEQLAALKLLGAQA